MKPSKRGIILMNLGSPDSTSVKDVHRYLMQFLMDKRVIDYPYLFRKVLVGGIIVPFRASKSAEAYRTIWTKDGSPLVAITQQLQNSLQNLVTEPIEISMRYGNPCMQTAYNRLLKRMPDLEEVLAIPMYPHYAMSSYETAVEWAREIHRKNKYSFSLQFIKPFFDNPAYIEALSEQIQPYIQKDFDHILFSYHGIPERHVKRTDITGQHCLASAGCCEVASIAHRKCYRHQCFQTTRLVAMKLGLAHEKMSISFQSRLGREQWLTPFTDFRLKEMPSEGIKNLLVICPSFVSDCLETLEEIQIRGKQSFLESGGEKFAMIPCMNAGPHWVRTLAGWIQGYKSGEKEMLLVD